MPVVNVAADRLKKFVPVKMERIMETLPFIGLDIEGVEDSVVRVEYNPNRPDFSSDYGIARALRGLLGLEIGMPKFKLSGKSEFSIKVDLSVSKVRPVIVSLVARNGRLDDETIKQLIAMQEDLHNGIGRRRKKASIGIHNLDAIKFPVTYTTVKSDYSFVPLGGSSSQTIKQILKDSDIGKEYGHILERFDRYPIIVDSKDNVLSFPPIINGDITKVDAKCHNLFVEVTATNENAAEDILAILAATLFDAGFKIQSVSVRYQRKQNQTPQMEPKNIAVDYRYVNRMLGLDLSAKDVVKCLKKGRLDAAVSGKKIICTVPRYRTDIFHPIDIVEEVAIGYGINNLEPTVPASSASGERSPTSIQLQAVRESLGGLGLLEVINFSLTSRKVQNELAGNRSDLLSVDATKSAEHEVLRDSLIPSLLQTLSRNIHEEYPQKLFEIGKVFKTGQTIEESWNAGAVIAHKDADYTEAKSFGQTLLKICFGKDISTPPATNDLFISGRCANIVIDGKTVGTIGEIAPMAIDNFKIRMPVSAFEINLSKLLS